MESCETMYLYAKQQVAALRAQSLLLCTKWRKQISTLLTYNEESHCNLIESQVYFLEVLVKYRGRAREEVVGVEHGGK